MLLVAAPASVSLAARQQHGHEEEEEEPKLKEEKGRLGAELKAVRSKGLWRSVFGG